MNKIISENTGKSVKEVEKRTDRDLYLTATEAIEFGIVDEILERPKDGAKKSK